MARADAARRLAGMASRLSVADRWAASKSWIAVLFHHLSNGAAEGDAYPFIDGLGITMAQDAFADCARYLARRYEVVALAELLSQVCSASRRTGARARRRVLICFDDAYKSVAELAAPVLAELELPWCFFVNPRLVGNSVLAADNAVAYVANT